MLVAQLYLILCDPMDCSPPGFSVHGILQARILKWVAIPFSEDLPNLGIKPGSPALQADSLSAESPGKPKYAKNPPNPATTLQNRCFLREDVLTGDKRSEGGPPLSHQRDTGAPRALLGHTASQMAEIRTHHGK